MEIRFVVTPWRSRQELLELRGALYGPAFEGREEAVNKILAWRVRKQELPLLLESTADIADAILQDEKGELQHNALRMVYATAISRFITGLSDTQTELSRDRPSWFLPNQSLQFPVALRETRHCIVHRHLPSLAELKRAAKESLEWLWEWYWSHLDAAFATSRGGEVGGTALTNGEARERLQGVLKSYVKERKTEIKNSRKEIEKKAAESAVASYLFLEVSRSTKQNLLLELLVDEKAILPAYKKLGTSMSGAFLVWSPFLLALCKTIPDFLPALLDRMVAGMCSPFRPSPSVETDPSREGMYEWCMQILTSSEWKETQQQQDATSSGQKNTEARLFDHILSLCFTSPTFWALKLAETLLENKDAPARESWLAVLKAAQSEDAMETVVETALPVAAMDGVEKATMTKLRGPQKRLGLWRPLPIGVPLAADVER